VNLSSQRSHRPERELAISRSVSPGEERQRQKIERDNLHGEDRDRHLNFTPPACCSNLSGVFVGTVADRRQEAA
jgi:hypothetical protein